VQYMRISDMTGSDLGVLRRKDLHVNSPEHVYLPGNARLRRLPDVGAKVRVDTATKAEFQAHQRSMLRADRSWLVASLILTILGGAIQLSWDIGKHTALFTPTDGWAAVSEIAKYLFLIVGVTGIATYRTFPKA
jgi:hypothetical protein